MKARRIMAREDCSFLSKFSLAVSNLAHPVGAEKFLPQFTAQIFDLGFYTDALSMFGNQAPSSDGLNLSSRFHLQISQ